MMISRILRRLKYHVVNWLLSDVPIERLRVIDLHVGEHSMKITPTSIIFHPNTADPSAVAGQMWYRSDTNDLKISDGSTTYYIPKAVGLREILVGPLSSRPAAGVAYRLYIATDAGSEIAYIDNGTSWVPLGAVYK